MARRWFGDGKTLDYIAPGVIVPDTVIEFPHCIGIALTGATLAGQKVIVAMEGVWQLPKQTGGSDHWGPGEFLYWSTITHKLAFIDSGGDPGAGLAFNNVSSADLFALVKINRAPIL